MYTLRDSIILMSYNNVYKGVVGVSVVWGEAKYESRAQVFIRVCNPWHTWLTMSHGVRSAVWVTDYVSRTEYVYQKLSWVSRVTLMSHAATSHTQVWVTNCICVTNWVCVSEIELGGMSESCHMYESRSHVTYTWCHFLTHKVWVTN